MSWRAPVQGNKNRYTTQRGTVSKLFIISAQKTPDIDEIQTLRWCVEDLQYNHFSKIKCSNQFCGSSSKFKAIKPIKQTIL